MEKTNNVIKFPKKKVKKRMSDHQRWWLILFLYIAVIVSVVVIEKIRFWILN